ncbi:MAG: ACT domain-containing protein [Candidatus Omnitrophica bacterium]|nr:ACT domain-containing protein [Candidatus Omnitrophota bacterium]
MAKCSKAKEVIITTEDKAGMLAEVTSALSAQGINISAICAYSMEGKAVFMIIASDNQKAKSVAESKGWKADESEVAVLELADKVGAAKEIAGRLKAKNVNLRYLYGTTCTCSPDCACRLVLKGDDNDAIIAALK